MLETKEHGRAVMPRGQALGPPRWADDEDEPADDEMVLDPADYARGLRIIAAAAGRRP